MNVIEHLAYKGSVPLLPSFSIYFKFCEGKAWGEISSNVLSSGVQKELFNVFCAGSWKQTH